MPRYSFGLLLLLLACGTDRAGSGAARDGNGASVAAANANGDTRRGEFVDGDERSKWMLTVVRDGSFSIEDDAHFGEDGQANRVFSFNAEGTLQRATEQRTQTAQVAGNRSPAPIRTELIVDFSGKEPVATKMVDDIRRTVEPYEIDNIRRRGDALLVQARRASSR